MIKLQKNLSLWAALLGLVLALSIRPAVAQTTSPSPQASPSDTESKKSKKSKKEKSSETSAQESKPSAASKPESATSDTGTTKKSKKSTKSEETSSAGAPSTPTKNAETSKPVPQSDKPAGGSKTQAAPVSSSEIASAQASGKVWVNTDSGVYHKGGQYYGHTKNGKFMTEAEAQKAGYREAKNEAKK